MPPGRWAAYVCFARGVRGAAAATADVSYPFDRGRGGPGGWWILLEPGIELPTSPEFASDIAGWTRERLPTVPHDRAITVVPDRVCGVLSPTTRGYHYLRKRPYYARIGVAYLWEVDVGARVVTVSRLQRGHWLDLGAWRDEDTARLPPFDAAALEVHGWWMEGTREE